MIYVYGRQAWRPYSYFILRDLGDQNISNSLNKKGLSAIWDTLSVSLLLIYGVCENIALNLQVQNRKNSETVIFNIDIILGFWRNGEYGDGID